MRTASTRTTYKCVKTSTITLLPSAPVTAPFSPPPLRRPLTRHRQTLGVVPLEKKIILRNTEVNFSIWDLGGQREFLSMLPLVCNEAAAIFFMFDLSNKDSLSSVKEWYRQARGLNRSAAAFLVGTKYDQFLRLSEEKQAEIDKQARKYAKAMKASVVFTSSTHSVNVQSLFKVVLAKVFGLRCTLDQIDTVGEPLLIFGGS